MGEPRHPLDALTEVDCGHVHHRTMCAQCAADAVRPFADQFAELENALNWGTSCTSCARMLDSSISEHNRAEDAEKTVAAYRELLGAIWLYVRWRYVTRQLTTKQKDLWADAVEATSDPADPVTADRWWRE